MFLVIRNIRHDPQTFQEKLRGNILLLFTQFFSLVFILSGENLFCQGSMFDSERLETTMYQQTLGDKYKQKLC